VKRYLLEEMTWPEVKEAVRSEAIVVIPVGSTEQHGLHLPLGTDTMISLEIVRRAAEKVGDEVTVVVAPSVNIGYSVEHMDFPGTITLTSDTFMREMKEVCGSLAKHGFKKVVILNSHGGNEHALGTVARDLEAEKGVFVAVASGSRLARDTVSKVRESEEGGIAHACEVETSIMLAIQPDLVRREQLRKEIPHLFVRSKFLKIDPDAPRKLSSFSWVTRDVSEYGVIGDPTLATEAKGEKILDAAVMALVDLLKELKELHISHPSSKHSKNAP